MIDAMTPSEQYDRIRELERENAKLRAVAVAARRVLEHHHWERDRYGLKSVIATGALDALRTALNESEAKNGNE